MRRCENAGSKAKAVDEPHGQHANWGVVNSSCGLPGFVGWRGPGLGQVQAAGALLPGAGS